MVNGIARTVNVSGWKWLNSATCEALADQIELIERFNALCRCFHAQGIGESDNSRNDRPIARSGLGRAAHAAHATRARRVPLACGTQRGKHARAQSQAHYKQQEGKRDKARGTALAASSSVKRGVFRRRTLQAALGTAQRWTPKQL